ncbi:MAG: histidine kinase, partial [Frankiales bacterium]|nr:histidine kinase [Frankiales bacterium]
TRVARAAAPEEVFAAVAEEAGRLLGAEITALTRYDAGGTATTIAPWSSSSGARLHTVGTPVALGGRNAPTVVFETGRPARLDVAETTGRAADAARSFGVRSSVSVPVSVEGRLWGILSVVSTRAEPLPADTEARLAGFTELVATAIANAQAHLELRRFAEEQAALRRVATLVARAAPAEEVFAAVAEEVGRVLSADVTAMSRYDPDGTATVVGGWARNGEVARVPIGTRIEVDGRNVTTVVLRTGQAARIDEYAGASGQAAALARERGVRSIVGVPISVEGRVWGVMMVASTSEQPQPPDTEARLAGFTELVATAIANVQARLELRRFAEEQAALRRVATLVARAVPPEEVFAAVTAEVGRVLSADVTAMIRYDPDDGTTIVGGWAPTGGVSRFRVGTRSQLGGGNVTTLVFRTGQAARIDDYADATGSAAGVGREWGFRSAVGAPISVEGRLWGVMIVAAEEETPLPADTEARLAGFTELIATALANAEAQASLTASRARIVAAADTTRRRIEQDLHDGAQQRLVSLALQVRAAQAATPPEAGELATELDGVVDGLTGVLEELREIAHGIHPAALAEGGLHPALKALARRSAVPVRLDVAVDGRLPEPIELAAYYVVSEALTNTTKHAHATVIDVQVAADPGVLRVCVRDDGRGGADPTRGSGLVGLTDRVEALGGQIRVTSTPGEGTTMRLELPLTAQPLSARSRRPRLA